AKGDQRIFGMMDPGPDSEGVLFSTDAVRLTAIQVDADVDSKNDDDFNLPDASRTAEEDQLEDFENKPLTPGKIIAVNDTDYDSDGVPDFADGFNWDGVAGNADDTPATAAQGEHFVPFVIEVSKMIDLTKAWLKIEYQDSDPANNANGMKRTGAGTAADPYE